jgi:hypothetical protein
MKKCLFKQLVFRGFILMAMSSMANAELTALNDSAMAKVQGQGVGIVLDNFLFNHGDDQANNQTFKIEGLKSTDGTQNVEITVSQLYIARSGSNYGSIRNPVNLGRLTNPFTIDVIDGNTIANGNLAYGSTVKNHAVLQFAAPTKVSSSQGYDCLSPTAAAGSGTCSSRPSSASWANGERPDIGLALKVKVGSNTAQNLAIHAKSAVFDGSYLRLWGDDAQHQMVAEFKLNFYTPELSINSCDATGQSCGSTIYLRNFELELALGNALQPMYVDVDGTGNFVYEIKKIRQPLSGEIGADGLLADSNSTAWNFYNDYYTNPNYRSNLRIGDLTIGDPSSTTNPGQDFGSARIEGMLIQYLKVTSHNIN